MTEPTPVVTFYEHRTPVGTARLEADGTVTIDSALEPWIREPRWDPLLERHLSPEDGRIWFGACERGRIWRSGDTAVAYGAWYVSSVVRPPGVRA